MTYVDDAFAKCKSTLEITTTEQNFASSKHADIRSVVRSSWQLDDDFLTGSYRRNTKTKRLKDVDIFVVIDPAGQQAGLRDQHPSAVLAELRKVLETKYANVVADGFACTIKFGDADDVASFDVVPAFKRAGGGWEIPDADRSSWISTNPKVHHEQSTKMNGRCEERFVPFVKMIKGINRHFDEPINPSFLLEVMAHGLVSTPFGRYQDEITWFLASAAEQISDDWPDPAGIGPVVNGMMSAAERTMAAQTLSGWQRIAEKAVRLEDAQQDRAAVEEWRELFGSRMPRP
ncbi:MAG: nucleotidyltransferase domain-containing protein [Actinobacteria bacterium]|nr:nucleotidyltransferase domain-containing protein [Actinomycetota bacterium]